MISNKVYIILYKAYEYDDIDTGDNDIIFCSLSKEKVEAEYNRLYNIEKERFEEYVTKDDYFEETDNTFTFSVGKWFYEYNKVEYELDKNLKWNK